MTRALSIGLPLLPAMFVGVTAGVGGSALRDMLLAQPVAMLKVGTLYAVAAIAGTIAVRMCAVWFGWSLPEQRAWMLSQRRRST
jgi:uncharacterized membrane protein YeiH